MRPHVFHLEQASDIVVIDLSTPPESCSISRRLSLFLGQSLDELIGDRLTLRKMRSAAPLALSVARNSRFAFASFLSSLISSTACKR